MRAKSIQNLEISPLVPHEAEKAASFFREIVAVLPYYNAMAKEVEMAKYSANGLLKSIEDDPSSVLIARLEGNVIGICISRLDDTLIWLSWFAVDPRFRRLGVGASLIRALEQCTRVKGLHKIWCDCRTNNGPSKNLLINGGFEPLCTIRDHWYRQDFILWEKSLA